MLEKLSRDLEDMIKTKMELLKMKNTMSEKKNVLDWINS